MIKGSLGRKTSAVAVALLLMCASFLVGGKVAGAKPTRVLNPHEQPQVQSSETASTPAVPAEIRLVENVKWVKTDAKGRILDYALIAPGEAETCHTDGITDKKSEVDVAEEVPEPATDNLGASSTTDEIMIRNVKWVKTNAEGVIVEYAVYSGPTHSGIKCRGQFTYVLDPETMEWILIDYECVNPCLAQCHTCVVEQPGGGEATWCECSDGNCVTMP